MLTETVIADHEVTHIVKMIDNRVNSRSRHDNYGDGVAGDVADTPILKGIGGLLI